MQYCKGLQVEDAIEGTKKPFQNERVAIAF